MEIDEAAFAQIFDRYHCLVYGVALRLLGEARAAEDVVQDVFFKFWTDPASFRGGHLGAWLSRVTRNRALDILRRASERPQFELPHDPPAEECVVDEVFARIDGACVRRAVAALDPAYRELLLLAYFGGMTHVELARSAALPLGTVKTRLRTALRNLRLQLSHDFAQETIAS
jgi:RNA polymerase sigma-70 factor (ECF subfamily)